MKKLLAVLLLIAIATGTLTTLILLKPGIHFLLAAVRDASGSIYFLEEDENVMSLCKLDAQGRFVFRKSKPKLTDGTMSKRTLLVSAPDGGVVLAEAVVNLQSFVVEQEYVYHYDANGRNERMLYTVQSKSNLVPSIAELTILDGELYIGSYGEGDDTSVMHVTRLGLGVERKAEHITTVSTDHPGGITRMLPVKGAVAYMTPDSRVFLVTDGVTREIGFGTAQPLIALFTANAAGELVIGDLGQGKLCAIDGGGSVRTLHEMGRTFGDRRVMAGAFTALAMEDDDNFVGMTSRGQGGQIAVVTKGEGTLVTPTRSAAQTALYIALISLAVFAGLVLLAMAVRAYRAKPPYIPMAARLVIAFIPVLVLGGAIILSNVNRVMESTIERQFQLRLFMDVNDRAERIDALWLSQLDIRNPYADPKYEGHIGDALAEKRVSGGALTDDGDQLSIHTFAYSWLFALREGEPFVAWAETRPTGLPIRFLYSEQVRANYLRAALTGEVVICDIKDVEGDWMIALKPIKYNDAVVGIIETGLTKNLFLNDLKLVNDRLTVLNAIIATAMALALAATLILMLRPVSEFKTAVQAMAAGKWGVQVKIRYGDEIAEIGRAFNSMSSFILQQMRRLQRHMDRSFRFVPVSMLELLGRANVSDVELSDQSEIEMTLMSVGIRHFEAISERMDSQEIFIFLNSVFEAVAPEIARAGGMIERYTSSGLLACMTGAADEALSAVPGIYKSISELNDRRAAGGFEAIELDVAMHAGPVMFGVVGFEERMTAMAVSPNVMLCQSLSGVAEELGSRLLITQALAERLSPGRFHCRYLGRVRLLDDAVPLYDCFDTDDAEQAHLKSETLEEFEEGVRFYLANSYLQARKQFVKVLRENPTDAAARLYLHRSDELYRDENASGTDALTLYRGRDV